MIQTSKKKQNLKLYAVALGVFMFLSIFLTNRFQNDFDHTEILKDVQEKIEEKDNELQKELQNLKTVYQEDTNSVFTLLEKYKSNFESKGFLFFIFEKDSLIFWSGNSVPVLSPKEISSNQIINTGNGYYRIKIVEDKYTTFIGLYLIKRDYNYQNEYLENDFHNSFKLSEGISYSETPSQHYNVNSLDGTFLFSISFDSNTSISQRELNILFIIYFITLLLIIVLIYKIHLLILIKTSKFFLFLFGFIADLIILRIAIFYFEIPRVLYQSTFFSPYYYGYSDLIPSIGDLFLNTIFVLILSFFIYRHVKFKLKNLQKSVLHKYFLIFSLFLHNFIFFKGIEFIFRSLIIDSSISLDLNNIFSLSQMSFLSFIIIGAAVLSYLLISSKLSFYAYKYSKNLTIYAILLTCVFIAFSIYGMLFSNADIWYLIFTFIYIFSFGVFFQKSVFKFSLGNIVFYILLFSIISTYSLHKYNTSKEKEFRKLLAVHLASEQRDPLAEYIFYSESEKVYKDENLIDLLTRYEQTDFDQLVFEEYFFRNFFNGYFEKYDYQITICNSKDILDIQPENIAINCDSYFDEIIESNGIKTKSPELSFLKYASGENGYIAVFDFSNSTFKPLAIKIYIELLPKYVARDLGFPDLLVNENIKQNPDLTEYSYAKYQANKLNIRVGEYFYNFDLHNYDHSAGQFDFFNQNGYNHLFYKIDQNNDLIISKKQKSIADILAPFSYLFLFFIFFYSVIFILFIFPFSTKKISLSLRTRLQLSMTFVILFSFLVIGVFTIIYINNLNDQKNEDILSEKTHSVLVEMQHKFSDIETFNEPQAYMITDLLIKFSNVFFTDINLFDLNGKLIASSRPQIYEEQLISKNINAQAYKALVYDNSSLFIHVENIGKQEYLSAYIPFVNTMGDVIAYLNLPYFSKENDLRREISAFLVTYINIYVILIALSLLIALFVSNYISRPLKMIMAKIRQVKLDGQNETIDWSKNDEIGQLVSEYNRMIDELAKSAELLAKSERESAWREMAKQVAHEIKNPLTPMKLSVQYLQRAWQNQSPNWDMRLEKFTQTMIEQINSLSAIASEFSDFAKIQLSKKENIDLIEIIKSSISLFKNYNEVSFSFDYKTDLDYTVFADKEQLLRAFNNLLKNSIQAIGTKTDGTIKIRIQKQLQSNIIEITDNGGGISEDIAGKIFSPNFTTKSGGMGLGLAIVKSIIINSGGEVSYTSHEGYGTTFIITLPLVN